jgi:DeoR family transcriptional regulator of aga operon
LIWFRIQQPAPSCQEIVNLRYNGAAKERSMSNSKALQRQEYIMSLLETGGDVSVKQLAGRLNVSMWTIRRDLNCLESRGILKRSYGQASPARALNSRGQLVERASFRGSSVVNLEAKQRIGLAAARMLHAGERVAIAGGTTTLEVAKALKAAGFKGEVITNALDIALELAEEREIHVICTGGDVQPRYHTLVGPVTEHMLKAHSFDVAVIGVGGISLLHGITTHSQVDATALELMLENSYRNILVADSTKLGRVSFARLSQTVPISCLVTDESLPVDYREYLRRANIRVVVADKKV